MTTPWWSSRLVAFDTETTGVDPLTARIVTAAVCRVGGGKPEERAHWIIDPGVEVPEGAAKIHGYTTERVRAEGRQARECVAEIGQALEAAWAAGLPVVVFNAPYDLTLLAAELQRHGLPPLSPGPVIDPLVLDKVVDRYRKGSRKLLAICEFRSVKHDGAHDCCADAIAAARLAYRLGSAYPEIGGLALVAMHTRQIGWFAEQARGLADHFERQGKRDAVPMDWPMRPVPAPVTEMEIDELIEGLREAHADDAANRGRPLPSFPRRSLFIEATTQESGETK